MTDPEQPSQRDDTPGTADAAPADPRDTEHPTGDEQAEQNAKDEPPA